MMDTTQPTRAIRFPDTIISTAAISRSPMRICFMTINTGLVLILLTPGMSGQAKQIIGPWVPKFKGVDHSVSTNIPGGGGFPNHHVVHALRIDLTDPDIRLHSTPR